MSEAHKGKPVSQEMRDRIRAKLKGRKLPESTRRKMSAAKSGEKHWNWGKKTSPETKEKMRLKKLGVLRSLEIRKKLSLARKGAKGPGWRGGVSKKNKLIRASLEYRLWREAVFKRDNFTCVWCLARCGNGKKVILNADHIKPFALFPELRFSIDNGRTLCETCHRTTETFGRNLLKEINQDN